MKRCTWRVAGAVWAMVAGLALGGGAVAAPTLPPGFSQTKMFEGWEGYLGVVFAPNGEGFTWTKDGRVFKVLYPSGTLVPAPVLDLREEVGNWRDFGLLGMTIDPDFLNNGRIYLAYIVDYHHLTKFGTPEYSATTDEYFRDTIGRVTRYTLNKATGFTSAVANSRRVLVGETISTGFPITHQSHSLGTVAWGRDGSLLVGCGDGASYDEVDAGGPRIGSSNTALADGIIQPKEDVGAFRAQMIDSLSGKIIRIDPETGDGLADNPFYDAAEPRAARSRVWVLGARNPFRFVVRPDNTPESHSGPPVGTIYMGEVGWNQWEELGVVRTGGKNLGWPLFEGLEPQAGYQAATAYNQDAPNPLYGVNGCAQPYLPFRSLLVQESLNPPVWPNPCNPSVPLVGTARAPLFVHQRPVLDWTWNGARAATFNAQGLAAPCYLNAPGCVQGSDFTGRSSTGGTFYTDGTYPEMYHRTYFHADWTGNWVRNFVFDEADRLVEIRPFMNDAQYVVHMTTHPITGEIWYTSYIGWSTVYRISYGGGSPPVVSADADVRYGPLPLAVNFTSAGTRDEDGGALTYRWDFGDGTPPSTEPNPTHVFKGPGDIAKEGTIVARVLGLTPPGAQGNGNNNFEVIRDGDRPVEGALDPGRQLETYRYTLSDQADFDWVGYRFAAARRVHTLVFQEGVHKSDGGWLINPVVEYFDGAVWKPVTGLACDPPYAGSDGVNYETYTFTFDAVDCLGIRLAGQPGGSNRYFTIAELRPIAEAIEAYATPQRFDVTLTVTDSTGLSSSKSLVISGNNTPPVAVITSPATNSTYRPWVASNLALTATKSDAEQSESELTCAWKVILHHQDHTHVEPAAAGCTPTVQVDGYGCGNEVYYYEVELTVSDPYGLSTTQRAFVWPRCGGWDYNRDGFHNLDDLADFVRDFYTEPAIPGGLQAQAPTFQNNAAGWMHECPMAGDAPLPYRVDAYRTLGYRVAFTKDESNACPLGPGAPFPNLDNLADFVTDYYRLFNDGPDTE